MSPNLISGQMLPPGHLKCLNKLCILHYITLFILSLVFCNLHCIYSIMYLTLVQYIATLHCIYPSQSIRHTFIAQLPLPLPFISTKDNQEPASARWEHCTATKCHHFVVYFVAVDIPAACWFAASASPRPFLVTSMSHMAQTPYAVTSGEASLRVLERLPRATQACSRCYFLAIRGLKLSNSTGFIALQPRKPGPRPGPHQCHPPFCLSQPQRGSCIPMYALVRS